MKNIDEIRKFIERRPKVKGAYGYGSGVFKQDGYTNKDKPQIDLILVVENLKDWHLENIKLNPKDYSFTGKRFFKKSSIVKIKKSTGITYLSNIEEDGKVYKYGTIEEKDLIKYLETWESFYLPGRFQKPNLPIIEDKKLTKKIEENRQLALLTGLFILDKKDNDLIDLYTSICSLSYLGDTRMKFAENPHKVANIVKGSYDTFKEMYGTGNDYFSVDKKDKIKVNYKKIQNAITKLPKALLNHIGDDTCDLEKVKNKIIEYFTNLNKNESSEQTIKGISTNGIIRSIKYASQKVLKKIKHK